jgi:transmembrane sensor
MNDEQATLDRMTDEAALWLIEADEGLSPARAREFEQWRRADARHEAALARLQWGHARLRELPEVDASLLRPAVGGEEAARVATWTRRWSPLRWGVAAAACAALVAVAVITGWKPAAVPDYGLVYACETGGFQRVALPDGSRLELNENSRVRVRFQAGLRRVELQAGEAHFTVAKDAARPFVVEAEGVAVRAVGTAFLVRKSAFSVDVLVTEGRVQVCEAASAGAAATTPERSPGAPTGMVLEVTAGEQTRVTAGSGWAAGNRPRVEKVSRQVIRQTLDWQERKLFFADVPLRDVVQEFNRRNRLQLVILDQELAARPVGGTFASDNIEGFLRLLEGSGVVTTERRGEWEVMLRSRTGVRE